MASRLPRWMRRTFWAALALFVAIQFVPYGRDHTNPPVTRSAAFRPGAGLDLARAACFDCHSNETVWPWHTNVAPASWLTQRDVDEGRAAVNFSEWDRPQPKADKLAESIEEGSMPPVNYTLIHPDARLSDEERATLLAAMRQMLRASPAIESDNSGHD